MKFLPLIILLATALTTHAQPGTPAFEPCAADEAVNICGMEMYMILARESAEPGYLNSCTFYVANRTANPQKIVLDRLYGTNGARRDSIPAFAVSEVAGAAEADGHTLTLPPDASARVTLTWEPGLPIYPACRGGYAVALEARRGASTLRPHAVLRLEVEFPAPEPEE